MRGSLLTVALVTTACAGDDADQATPASTTATASATTTPATRPTTDELRAVINDTVTAGSNDVVPLNELLRNEGVPGVSYAVVQDGEVVLTGAAGVDPADGQPVAPDTIYQVGSIAKPVTAITAAALADAETLSWDGPLTDHVTSLDLPAGESSADNLVTLERTLAHRGGFNLEALLGYAPDDPIPSVPELLAGDGNTEALAVVRRPGGSTVYSSGGYSLVGQAIEDTAGADFAAVAAETVLDPLGMESSAFAVEAPDGGSSRATAGSVDGSAFDVPYRRYPELGAAGLWATAPDLAQLVIGFQASLRGDEGAVVGQGRAQSMVEYTGSRAGSTTHIGRGWWLDDDEDPGWFWHRGQTVGFASLVAGSIDGRDGIVVLTNGFDGDDVADALVDTVSDASGWTDRL